MGRMRKVVLIAAVAVFVLALSAQALASWTAAGAERTIGTTTVDDSSLAQIESALKRDPRVNFTADLSATNADLELKAHGTLRARVIGPQGD